MVAMQLGLTSIQDNVPLIEKPMAGSSLPKPLQKADSDLILKKLVKISLRVIRKITFLFLYKAYNAMSRNPKILLEDLAKAC
jgi:hypothetical protein